MDKPATPLAYLYQRQLPKWAGALRQYAAPHLVDEGFTETPLVAASDLARLTAINAELVEALSLAVAYLSEIPHDPALKIAAALARAKEASHDAD